MPNALNAAQPPSTPAPEPLELDRWLADRRAQVDDALAELFQETWPAAFAAPLRYPLTTGGKRIRPALAIAAFEALHETPVSLEPVLPAAVAVELVHTYSLVHDDLPAMDDDETRRGKPTVHVAFGEATAILVGDALLTEAFSVLATAPLPAGRRICMVRVLAEAAGHRGMVGGQAADIGRFGPTDDLQTLTRLHAGKTGALIEAATHLGGTAAGAPPAHLDALASYGKKVGLAFQLADDLLDAEEDAGADGPPSFVKLLGAEETRARAQTLADEAIDAVAELPRPEILRLLARFAVDRDL